MILSYLPKLILIFITILCLILLVRMVLTFMINRSYRHYIELKKAGKKIVSWKKNYVKEEEEMLRKKEIPRAHSAIKAEMRKRSAQGQSGNYELMSSDEEDKSKHELNQVEIVDIVKPIGFFTAMILGQKLGYLIQSAKNLNKNGNKGFWVSMIEAKDRSAGRQHGRG